MQSETKADAKPYQLRLLSGTNPSCFSSPTLLQALASASRTHTRTCQWRSCRCSHSKWPAGIHNIQAAEKQASALCRHSTRTCQSGCSSCPEENTHARGRCSTLDLLQSQPVVRLCIRFERSVGVGVHRQGTGRSFVTCQRRC